MVSSEIQDCESGVGSALLRTFMIEKCTILIDDGFKSTPCYLQLYCIICWGVQFCQVEGPGMR